MSEAKQTNSFLEVITVKVKTRDNLAVAKAATGKVLEVLARYSQTDVRVTISKPGFTIPEGPKVWAIITCAKSLHSAHAQQWAHLIAVEVPDDT